METDNTPPRNSGAQPPQYSPVSNRLPDELPGGKPEKNRENTHAILSTLALIIIAPLIALTLTAFVFQSYQVDGPSMQSTLQNNDRLIVLKIPRTWARVTGHPYIPHRADIIIFNKTDISDFGTSEPKQLIKRVIGLPGDRVVVKNGLITVYDKSHPQGFNPDKTYPYGKVIHTTPGNLDITVPKNSVFVCGDNRTNSLDSRIFGPIPLKDIVGKLSLRVYPLSKAETF